MSHSFGHEAFTFDQTAKGTKRTLAHDYESHSISHDHVFTYTQDK
jgi:hypothetical protein